ncbi:hypothetical protein [Deinococcus radiophilus]|uniref:DUF5666 domain-containing protein n=1 Tax=Deinococcus radiophilus TaxID=32062 RepID=A0A431W1M5_9DEIO|nr:hypothetical protein [Deinococcus radiophilus]RTR29391.1 hypothetical protein EJ104_03095 [Deinococcus radiophilus]UFA50782.1 hypothetical protein LMT64_02415 [Deinococcus radiophilus]
MKRLTLLFLSLGLMACAPQESTTTTAETAPTTTTTAPATTDTTTTTATASTNDWEEDALTWDSAGQSFTFEDDGQTYTVVTTTQTTYDDNGTAMDAGTFFGTDRTGEDIEVAGELSGTTITATRLSRDD